MGEANLLRLGGRARCGTRELHVVPVHAACRGAVADELDVRSADLREEARHLRRERINAAAKHQQQADKLKGVQPATQQGKEQVGAAIQRQEQDAAAARARALLEQQRARGSPVGKRELDALEAQREKPAPALQLNPPGGPDLTIAEQRRQEREARIKYIQERMGLQQDRSRDGFNTAAPQRPKGDHER